MCPNVTLIRIPDSMASMGFARVWFENVRLKRLIEKLQSTVIVSLANLGPICPAVPHVVFQRNALLFSPEHLALFGTRQIARFRIQRALAIATMKFANRIVTPSAAMTSLIRAQCPGLAADRFTVLPHAFEPEAYSQSLDPLLAARFMRPGLKILYPALASPHKGMSLFVDVIRAIPSSIEFTAFLTGGDEGGTIMAEIRAQVAQLGLGDRVVFLGRVPQQQMGAIYQACDIMLYTSLVESFGFSLLEAMAFKLPVVAVDTEVNREIGGSASFYFPKTQPAEGARLICALLPGDLAFQARNVAKAQFESIDRSWSGYCRSLLSLVRVSI